MKIDFDKKYQAVYWECGSGGGVLRHRSLRFVVECVGFDRKWWQFWKTKLDVYCFSAYAGSEYTEEFSYTIKTSEVVYEN